MKLKTFVAFSAVALTMTVSASKLLLASGGHTLFIQSAVQNPNGTATLPLYRGTSRGQTVYYVMTDSSDGTFSQQFGLNRSQKLANAAGSNGVQNVTIVNAPHIANGTGKADKAISIDLIRNTVTYRQTDGFQGGDPVKYMSFDASNPVAATLEDVTLAPALDALPTVNDDSTASSRATLVAFVNGQTGANNPQRQGLNSAILDGLDPLNLLRWNPSQGRYSPMWDVNLAKWTDQIVAAGQNVRQTDVGTAQGLAQQGQLTAPDGGPLTATGFIVNCPIVSLR